MKRYTLTTIATLSLALMSYLPTCLSQSTGDDVVYQYTTERSTSTYQDAIYQLLTAESMTSLILDLDDQEVEIIHTKGSRILIEVHIEVIAPNQRIVDYLVAQERYHLNLEQTDPEIGAYKLVAPERPLVVVSGEELQEKIWYRVSIPENTTYDFATYENLGSAFVDPSTQ